MTDINAYLEGWNPDAVSASDPMDPRSAQALAKVLESPGHQFDAGHELPPLWQWVHFLDWPANGELGADGHPVAGHFLPPIPDRRRMFAGGRSHHHAPLLLGRAAERTSRVVGTEVKQGSSGQLAFVTVRSEFHQNGTLRLVEEQDLVYRSGESQAKQSAVSDSGKSESNRKSGDSGQSEQARTSGKAGELPTSAASWQERFSADPTRLFRFSALTANAHRIHYDEPYARGVESYPGLVVHGPLLTLLMSELARRSSPERRVASVDFRLKSPVFARQPVLITGEPDGSDAVSTSVLTGSERTAASAQVTFA